MTYPNDPNQQPPYPGGHGGDPHGQQYPPQQPPSQQPTPPYPQYGQPDPYSYGGYAQQPTRGTNKMAIASLITSGVGLLVCSIACPVGAILGHVALGRIKKTGEEGRGLALAGIIIGWVGTVLLVVVAAFVIPAVVAEL